ncbi:hypothetical protein [Xanthomarina sp.]|uniref:hypothetical protein n=1 Tax=Xanthomarina sp. TaxID=1931211 RepID=UPI002CBC723B|nr:hypothetical protein [Xanthomarina sp.]HLV37924.1 hypothetical protein [Xanthomarina sp.]
MKTICIGLLFLGFANLSFSQADKEIVEVQLASVVISSPSNPSSLNYLNAVYSEDIPEEAVILENIAARFKITESPVFDSQFEAYEVIFKDVSTNGGQIVITYNNDGQILKSVERYNDVVLPAAVRNAVYKEYPGWMIDSDKYLVTYYHKEDAKKAYKLKIKKEDNKKVIKVSINGDIL